MAKRQLDIDVRPEGTVQVVRLSGAIDASNVAEFQDTMNRLCSVREPNVLLDCSDLTYVNSTSFGLIFRYHQSCLANNGRLAICALRDKIFNIIKILGLEKFLDIYPDRTSALAPLRKTGSA